LRFSETFGFRHPLEAHDQGAQIAASVNSHLAQRGLLLKTGAVVDATLIAAPSSSRNKEGRRDPEMVSGDESQPRTTKKGNPWHFGMKARIGVDADGGLAHTVVGRTAAHAHDVTQAGALLHGEETDVFADFGYRGVEKREEVVQTHPGVAWLQHGNGPKIGPIGSKHGELSTKFDHDVTMWTWTYESAFWRMLGRPSVIYRVMRQKVYIDVIADGRRDMPSLLARRLLGNC